MMEPALASLHTRHVDTSENSAMNLVSVDTSHFTSETFKDHLRQNVSQSGVQVFRLKGFTPPSGVHDWTRTPTQQCDTRPLVYGSTSSAPMTSAWPSSILHASTATSGSYSPTETEYLLRRSGKLDCVYAPDVFLERGTLLDADVPLASKGTVDMRSNCFRKRHSYCWYAPTSIAASDDGFGARGRLDPGIASATGLVSGAFTTARFHAEDGFLGSANLLLYGSPKVRRHHPPVNSCSQKSSSDTAHLQVWYVVSPQHAAIYLDKMICQYGGDVGTSKRLYPVQPSFSDLAIGKITRLVQQPGDLVITQPGPVFHWTLSTGYSICEACNFFIEGLGVSWNDCTQDCISLSQKCLAACESAQDCTTFCNDRLLNANIIRNACL